MAGREGKQRRVVPRQSRSAFRTIAVLMLVPIAGLLVFLAFRFVRSAVRPSPQPRVEADVLPSAPKPSPPPPARRAHGQIVLILDDIGFSHQQLERAMEIDPNLNFAVLPNSGHAAEYARALHARGFELLCHLPMEPIGYPNPSPGPNAVLTSMSDEEIARTTRENVGAVPYARGVNNHMGSRATTDRRVMTTVLGSLPPGMYFIDSKTTPDSLAAPLARRMRIRTAARDVFLDDKQSEPEVRHQLALLAAEAEARGIAVGIGHPYPVTIAVLSSEVPRLRQRGLRLVRASEVVE